METHRRQILALKGQAQSSMRDGSPLFTRPVLTIHAIPLQLDFVQFVPFDCMYERTFDHMDALL